MKITDIKDWLEPRWENVKLIMTRLSYVHYSDVWEHFIEFFGNLKKSARDRHQMQIYVDYISKQAASEKFKELEFRSGGYDQGVIRNDWLERLNAKIEQERSGENKP